MKSLFASLITALLFVAVPVPCHALRLLAFVTKEKAKEMGIEIRVTPAGPDAVRIALEFPTKGQLKDYSEVDLEFGGDGDKSVLSSALKEEPTKPGHILVSFAAERSQLNRLSLRILAGEPESLVYHVIRVKEFVDLEKLR
jgi:hypothetical protein